MIKPYYDILILGGGAAALHAAEAARAVTSEASICMISAEPMPPYSRPMLTKLPFYRYRAEKTLLRTEQWFQSQQIELCLSITVTALDAQKKEVTTSAGTVAYGKCIYALGAHNFIPPFYGKDLPGVMDLRTEADVYMLRRRVVSSQHAVIIGGGVIGLEAAYRLAEIGLKVTVLETAPYLMSRLLDEESSRYLQSRISCFTVHTGVRVLGITGNHRAQTVEVEGMEAIPAEVVLVSCGIRANSELAKIAGAEVERAVVVNESMETSLPDIYACGDCTQFAGVNTGLWAQAIAEGRVAGTNAAGGHAEYTGSDMALIMDCKDFGLYCAGDMGKNPSKIYTHKAEVTHRSPMVELNERQRECYVHDFFCEDRLVGTLLLGDLTAMQEKNFAIMGRQQ